MKMEKAAYRAVQLQKDAENRKNTFSKAAIKQSIVSAASAEPGGDAGAAFLSQQGISVTDSRERINLEE